MSIKKTDPRIRHTMWVDLRLPFAICAAEALLLLGLMTVLSFRSVKNLPLIGLCVVIFYLATAGVTLLTYVVRYARAKQAEAAAEQVGTDIYRLFRTTVDLPYAVVNGDGTIRVINTALQTVLGYRSPVCSIPLKDVCPGITMEQVITVARRHAPIDEAADPSIPVFNDNADPADSRAMVVRLCDGRRYHIDSYLFRRAGDNYYFLIFRDVNDHLELLDEVNRTHPVMAYIMLENLQ